MYNVYNYDCIFLRFLNSNMKYLRETYCIIFLDEYFSHET